MSPSSDACVSDVATPIKVILPLRRVVIILMSVSGFVVDFDVSDVSTSVSTSVESTINRYCSCVHEQSDVASQQHQPSMSAHEVPFLSSASRKSTTGSETRIETCTPLAMPHRARNVRTAAVEISEWVGPFSPSI
jgi:hypothetical protein